MFQLLVGTDFPLMRFRRIAYVFSSLFVLATLVWLVMHGGPKYSVDFTGGQMLQVRISENLHADQVRAALDAGGLRGVEIQSVAGANTATGEFMIRAKHEANQDLFSTVQRAITTARPGATVELRRIENVGPKVGSELRQKAIWAVLGSLGWILLYVGWRYEFKFAVGAIVALFHDVLVTLGVLTFLGREISLTVVAALLTIAGYSINDTIVVFDRIRERSKALKKEKHSRVMDIAVNETLSRTLITAFTVFLTALALFVWGGEVIRDFSLAMLIGLVFGTYSSVYVASALALDIWIWLDRRKGVQAE